MRVSGAARAAICAYAVLESLAGDPDAAPLSSRALFLVRYALKLTRTPSDMTPDDVVSLRQAGLGDAGIHDAACVVAYFNFVNRIADGLGIQLDA